MEGVDGISLPIKDTQTTRNKEIQLNNGEKVTIPTLHVAKMPLFHGSPVAGIAAFDVEQSDQMTIGKGIYFTPNREPAIAYAKWRSNEAANPTLYEAEIQDADIADLRTRKAQEEFAKLHKQALLDWEQNVLPTMKGPSEELTEMIKEQRKEMVADTVKKIDENSWVQLRDITFNWADLVSRTLSTQGYKGLTSIEGEPPKVDFHDSVVVFNPQDAPIIHQQAA
jgi:hypothetical protein